MTQLKPFDDLYAVPIPKGAKNVTLIQSHSYFYSPRLEHSMGGADLPTYGKWKPLFTTESATEQDWAGVVGVLKEQVLSITHIIGYERYNGEKIFRNGYISNYPFKKPSQSGHSLLAANGLEGNYAIVKKCERG